MKKNRVIILIVISFIFFSAVMVLFHSYSQYFVKKGNLDMRKNTLASVSQNVVQDNGTQKIEIQVGRGYFPKVTTAQAGKLTKVDLITSNTYDCSTAFLFPKLGIRRNLPPNGSTIIEIPSQESGTELVGTCSMGMYRFVIKFI